MTTDASDLEGLDPYAALDAEAERIDRFLSALPDEDEGWNAPTGCAAWTRRDLLGHLAAVEEYHHACLDDELPALFERLVASGATDLDGFNAFGVHERADQTPSQVLAEWRAADAVTRRGFRERGDGQMSTSVGPYPARWQAFHVASELATHADDLGVPESPDEVDARLAWRVPFSRFSLKEAKPDVTLDPGTDGTTVVEGDGVRVELDDATFVTAVAGRLPEDAPLGDDERRLLSTMP